MLYSSKEPFLCIRKHPLNMLACEIPMPLEMLWGFFCGNGCRHIHVVDRCSASHLLHSYRTIAVIHVCPSMKCCFLFFLLWLPFFLKAKDTCGCTYHVLTFVAWSIATSISTLAARSAAYVFLHRRIPGLQRPILYEIRQRPQEYRGQRTGTKGTLAG